MTPSSPVWLLLDEKASHRSQLTGVAEWLGAPYSEKEIHYNASAKLANGLFGARLWHLTPQSRDAITGPWPNVVIAAGRRSAPVSLAIKKRSPGTKLVHLMWPDVTPGRFSLIAVPEHDKLPYSGTNLLRTCGAPNAITPAHVAAEAERFYPHILRLPPPYIAVLIGGSSRHIQYEPADFKTLAAYASAEAERLGGSLLVTTSPRTGTVPEQLFRSILTAPHFFHSCGAPGPNPYAAFLGLADAIIVTGDSVSMCSEACTTQKPVYIFTPPHLARDKKAFREILFAQGYAKPHTYPVRPEWQPAPMPNAARQVAEAIRPMLIGISQAESG